MRQDPGGFAMPATGQPGRDGPWTSAQVRMATFWPGRRDQLVSVALSPTGDRLAHSVGPRLSVSSTAGNPRVEYRLPVLCGLSPGLTWSPDGTRLAFRDDSGQARVVDLSGLLSPGGAQARIPLLGMASALAFVPGDDRVAILAPSLPGRMTLCLTRPDGDRPDRDAVWERTLPRNRTARLAWTESTSRCRPTGAGWPAPQEHPTSGFLTPLPGGRGGSSTGTNRLSPAWPGSTTNGWSPPLRTRRSRCGAWMTRFPSPLWKRSRRREWPLSASGGPR